MQAQRTDDTVALSVKEYLLKQFPKARQKGLALTTPLLESGIVDSLGILEVVAFLESEFGITVADEDLMPENFQTVEQVAGYVQAKQRAGLSR